MAKKILVVDDDEDSRNLASLVLRRYGFLTLEASDGEVGVALAKSSAPDLILLDLGLKGMDGFLVGARLKGHAATKGIPLVALTAYAGAENREKAKDAGFDGYITKPIEVRSFPETVSSYLKGGGI